MLILMSMSFLVAKIMLESLQFSVGKGSWVQPIPICLTCLKNKIQNVRKSGMSEFTPISCQSGLPQYEIILLE